jgi:hypothetical protein
MSLIVLKADPNTYLNLVASLTLQTWVVRCGGIYTRR